VDIERRKVPKPKEANSADNQYWVRFRQITVNDINALLGIYKSVTGESPLPAGERDFNRLCEEFTSDYGLGVFMIQRGSNLEARRRVSFNGELFVRFKINVDPNIGHNNSRYKKDRDKIAMQNAIDTYFLSKQMAVPLGETY
jgi:hypothetical protein